MKTIISLFAAASVFFLTGCQQNSNPSTTTGEPPAANQNNPPTPTMTNMPSGEMHTNAPTGTNQPAGTQ